eukprot:Skav222195  [mRNA]  locus=scaffold1745:62335:62589:+ [translate_table: standard]
MCLLLAIIRLCSITIASFIPFSASTMLPQILRRRDLGKGRQRLRKAFRQSKAFIDNCHCSRCDLQVTCCSTTFGQFAGVYTKTW